MKNKIIFIGFLGTAFAVLTAMVNGPSSSGAPAAHTGAPGELSCATAGCHDDNPLNAGVANIELITGENNQYVAKKSYPLTISVTDPSITRFGFQVVAISEITGKSVGKFTITDAERTQLLANNTRFPDREYATYTFNGTDATEPGKCSWVLNWKAPSENTGPVKFYVATVSANDNENDKGDFVYLKSFQINEKK